MWHSRSGMGSAGRVQAWGGGREVVWWLVRVRAGMVRSAFVLGHGCHCSLDPLCMRTCPLYIVNAPSAALCIDSV